MRFKSISMHSPVGSIGKLLLGAVFSALLLTGCPEPTQSKSPDSTRAMSPVPTCVRGLGPNTSKGGFSRQIPEEEYWSLIVPDFREGLEGTSRETLACNGASVFKSELFEGASLDSSALKEGRLTYGGGANRLKIIWLRTHTTSNGLAVGPVSLVRVMENYAEVYGIGVYRGDPEKTRFDLERLGGEVVLTAVSDGCAGANGSDCDTRLEVFRPTDGHLPTLAVIGLQIVRHAEGLEPGIVGKLKFELMTSPAYEQDGIHVIEEVSVTDEGGHKLRRAQLERVYLLDQGGAKESAESLWERLYVSRLAKGSAALKNVDSAQVSPTLAQEGEDSEDEALEIE